MTGNSCNPLMERDEILSRIGLVPGSRLGENVSDEIAEALAWMMDDLNARRDQGPLGLDPAPLSPAMQKAMRLLEDLRAGRIECRRVP